MLVFLRELPADNSGGTRQLAEAVTLLTTTGNGERGIETS